MPQLSCTHMKPNISIVKTWPEAKRIFCKLTDNATIFDTWNFRYTFAKYEPIEPYFIIHGNPDAPRALLPLEFNRTKKVYESFGTYYMEENHIYGETTPEIEREIFSAIPTPAHLECLNPIQNTALPFISPADPKYILPTDQYINFEDYLHHKILNGETRGKMRRKFANTEEKNNLKIIEGAQPDLEIMFEYNKQMFGADSSFNDPNREQIFRDLTHLFTPDILTVKSGEEIVGVSFALIYNNRYIRMNTGNVPSINNLGNYLHFASIKRAIELHKTLDAMAGSYHWKEDFHLDQISQFTFKNF